MRSIDGINLVRVRTPISVAQSAMHKQRIDIKNSSVPSDPTILSTLDKNARLVFYSSIQSAPAKTSSRTVKRTRKNNVATSENISQRMSKLLERETEVSNTTSTNFYVNPETQTLPLFNYSTEYQQTNELANNQGAMMQQVNRVSRQARELVSKRASEITNKADSMHGVMGKFVATVDRKLKKS